MSVERRRRAAVPMAAAALVGVLVVASGSGPDVSLAGDATPPTGISVRVPSYAYAVTPSSVDTTVAEPPATDTPALPADEPVEASVPEPAAAEPATEPAESAPEDTTPDTTEPADSGPPEQPAVKHVFLVVLSDQSSAIFAKPSPATYLAQQLVPQGTLLSGYHAVTRGHLANTVALVSGQGPTNQTKADCPVPSDVAPATIGDDSQEAGDGCVYSPVTGTLFDQLRGNDKTWGAYVGGMGPIGCRGPAAGPDFQPWENPAGFFHTIVDDPKCATEVADLSTLGPVLDGPADKTPSLAYLTPPRTQAPDQFLREWIPRIAASKAYADGGMIVITSDQSTPQDVEGCCLKPKFPNVPETTDFGGTPGALLLSPLLPAGLDVSDPVNHFDLLASLEDLFGLQRLGYAARPEVTGVGLPALALKVTAGTAKKQKIPLPSPTVAPGPSGPSGPTGPTGISGPSGPSGATGPAGP